ncbi:MAG: hypothetical protein K0S51_758 [Bacillales bacterium]|nr:hypothetical protein [Bacillales bacterium]
MRTYFVYWMKEDVLLQYFGKEALIYNLLTELDNSDPYQKMLLEKQISFITKCMPVSTLQKFLLDAMDSGLAFNFDKDNFSISLTNCDGSASLSFHSNYLTIKANGSKEAEIIWFEKLRKFAPSFFAIQSGHNLCGWLSPLKQRKYV